MSAKISNNAWGTLNADISATATSIQLVAGDIARFPLLSTGDYAWGTLCNPMGVLEVVKITSISGNTVQVVRGQDGTTARAYVVGDRLDLRIPAALINGKLDAADAAKQYVTKDSPTLINASLTGTTTSVTPPAGANDSRVATTEFVNTVALNAGLPGQNGNAGKFITTDGTSASWAPVYPPLSGMAGKVLSNDGTATVWVDSGAAETQQTLTELGTIQWDTSKGAAAVITLTGDRNMGLPTHLSVRTYVLLVRQDATGNRKITWNSAFKWPGKVAPVLSTEPNAVDVFSFYSDGTSLYGSYLRGVG